MSDSIPIITIDGPSGTGKGTIAIKLAKHYKWHYLDSGALYRVVAYTLQQKQLNISDIKQVKKEIKKLTIECVINDQELCSIKVNGRDVSKEIRSEEVSSLTSKLSVYPEIREMITEKMKSFKKAPGLVADGRDLGTIVFPEAICKMFLDADVHERAQRRYNQLKQEGRSVNLINILNDMVIRDTRDSTRDVAPLKKADDALIIDTTGVPIEGVLKLAVTYVKAKNLGY